MSTTESTKLCECGCGSPAPIATWTSPRRGHVKGQPVRFIYGHQNRKAPAGWSVDLDTGCWIWHGTIDRHGYGKVGGRLAHRVMYEQRVGPIPDDRECHHTCRRTACVNPAHLEIVSREEHVALRWGRRERGHCRYGHPLDEHNAYVRAQGHVECRTCIRESARRYRARKAVA